jgi:hypothetical protein
MNKKSDNVLIPNFLADYKYIGKGCECKVYEIVKHKLVCKVYASYADARYNYVLQRIGFRGGIAAEPLALENNYYFSRYVKAWIDMKANGNKLWYTTKDEIKFRNFQKKITEIFGGYWNDNHSGNVGILVVNGIECYVIIDFGVAGFEKTELGERLSNKLEVYWNGC